MKLLVQGMLGLYPHSEALPDIDEEPTAMDMPSGFVFHASLPMSLGSKGSSQSTQLIESIPGLDQREFHEVRIHFSPPC